MRKRGLEDAAVHYGRELDEWHVVARSEDLAAGRPLRVRLLQQVVEVERAANGTVQATCEVFSTKACERYGLVWVSLGAPGHGVTEFSEFEDARYKTTICGPYGVNTSAPRVVENFLDMAHFPYVHSGVLGEESHTEIKGYDVKQRANGVGPIATNCLVWQPKPNFGAVGGDYVAYTYEVPRPYSAILRRILATPGAPGTSLFLAVQPLEPTCSIAWILYSFTDHSRTGAEQRARENAVFLQDKPIIENQLPKLLPLDLSSEVSIRCDRLSTAYRRYLRDSGVRFGVLRAESCPPD